MTPLTKRQILFRVAVITIGIEISLAFIGIGVFKHFVPFPPGLSNEQSYHYGHDFVVFYSAAELTLDGRPGAAYKLESLRSKQEQTVGRDLEFAPWVYPPTFLLVVLPFGLLPYIGAYMLWCASNVAAGAVAGWQVVRRWWSPALVLLFPATWLNLFAGQNGGITAGLMLGGLGLLNRHPVAAGVLFGLVSYKPQFGLLLPIALAAGRHWSAFAAAAATVIGFAGVSAVAFGMEPWRMFISQLRGDWATQSDIFWWFSVTVYPMARSLGLAPAAATTLQAASALVSIVVVAYVWHRRMSLEAQAAALTFGTLLATPRALMYDLALLVIPLFFLVGRMIRRATPADWMFLGLLWLCPLAGHFGFEYLQIQFWPVLIAAALAYSLYRAGGASPHRAMAD